LSQVKTDEDQQERTQSSDAAGQVVKVQPALRFDCDLKFVLLLYQVCVRLHGRWREFGRGLGGRGSGLGLGSGVACFLVEGLENRLEVGVCLQVREGVESVNPAILEDADSVGLGQVFQGVGY
jgi:hypothetical protein